MPTKKPRLNLSLPVEINETITRLAELQGRSRPSIVLDMLQAIHEPLMRTVALLEAAREAPKEVIEGLSGVVEEVASELMQSAGESVIQMDFLLHQMGAAQPPHSNTRVRSDKNQVNQQLKKMTNGGKNA